MKLLSKTLQEETWEANSDVVLSHVFILHWKSHRVSLRMYSVPEASRVLVSNGPQEQSSASLYGTLCQGLIPEVSLAQGSAGQRVSQVLPAQKQEFTTQETPGCDASDEAEVWLLVPQ